jgi:hypothetical protein
MKEYYILKGEEKNGPFSIQELENQKIYSDTLIGMDGWEKWKQASEIPEIKHLISKGLPPIPNQTEKSEIEKDNILSKSDMFVSSGITANIDDDYVPIHPKYDYSQVEDIAGVDYRKAMYATGAYIGINLFFKEQAVLGFFGILISTTLVVFVWFYFKKYFDAMKDYSTAKWIQWVMGAHILFGVVNLFSYIFTSIFSVPGRSEGELVQGVGFMIFGIIASMLIVFISGFKLIGANKKNPFPLKRIALSTMFLVPLYMTVSLFENMPFLKELVMVFGGDDFETGLFFNCILMIPFFFLLQHFYRADKYDATPD